MNGNDRRPAGEGGAENGSGEHLQGTSTYRYVNFAPTVAPEEIPEDIAGLLCEFVHKHPFQFTLVELAKIFDLADATAAHAALRLTVEDLSAIPRQEGHRHVWGYSADSRRSADEWEYLSRRLGGVISSLKAMLRRSTDVCAEYGPPGRRASRTDSAGPARPGAGPTRL